MKYHPVKGMALADNNYRERGGRWKGNDHLTARQMWWREGVRRASTTGFDMEELTTLERLAEKHLTYDTLAPTMSVFALIEEAGVLYAPQMEERDVRLDFGKWFRPKAKTRFHDPNHGRPIFTVGTKKGHGDGCECYECVPEEREVIHEEDIPPRRPKPYIFHKEECECEVCVGEGE